MLDPYAVGSVVDSVAEALTLRKTTGGTYSAATRTVTGGTTATYAIGGHADPYRSDEVDGTSIRRGDLRYWIPHTRISAHGVSMAVGDHIDRGGTVYRIEDIVEPAGPNMVYVVQLRGVE